MYQQKYLAYKSKYEELKVLIGGVTKLKDETHTLLNNFIKSFPSNLKYNSDLIDISDFVNCKANCSTTKLINKLANELTPKIYGVETTHIISEMLKNYATYNEKDNKVFYHDKSHALITAFVACKLWKSYAVNLDSDTLENTFLAALAHDIHHDGSQNAAKKCTLENPKSSEKCYWSAAEHMEKVHAVEAIKVYDQLFKKDLVYEKSKNTIHEAIEHTWMKLHLDGKTDPLEKIPNSYIIVHAADIISQILQKEISDKLGQRITHELDVTNDNTKKVFIGEAKDHGKKYAVSQLGFLNFFKYVEFWLHFIQRFDSKKEKEMSLFLAKNLKTNTEHYESLASGAPFTPITL